MKPAGAAAGRNIKSVTSTLTRTSSERNALQTASPQPEMLRELSSAHRETVRVFAGGYGKGFFFLVPFVGTALHGSSGHGCFG